VKVTYDQRITIEEGVGDTHSQVVAQYDLTQHIRELIAVDVLTHDNHTEIFKACRDFIADLNN